MSYSQTTYGVTESYYSGAFTEAKYSLCVGCRIILVALF
jgi:hypothetical protein